MRRFGALLALACAFGCGSSSSTSPPEDDAAARDSAAALDARDTLDGAPPDGATRATLEESCRDACAATCSTEMQDDCVRACMSGGQGRFAICEALLVDWLQCLLSKNGVACYSSFEVGESNALRNSGACKSESDRLTKCNAGVLDAGRDAD